MLAVARLLAGSRTLPATTPPRRRLGIALGIAALTIAVQARADIVIGPGGHVPFGGASQWEARGESVTMFGTEGWTLGGITTGTSKEKSVQDGNATVWVDNVAVTQTSGTAKLSAEASVNAVHLGSGRVSARGWSTAIINDIVFVQPAGGSFNFGKIDFEWTIDGELQFLMESESGMPLNMPHGVKWAHYAKAQTFVTYTDPFTGVIEHSDETIGQISMLRSGASPMTADQQGGLDYLRNSFESDPQTVNATIQLGSVPHWEDYQQYSQSSGYTNLVNGPWGFPIPVMLGLATFYNVIWEVEDFGSLTAGINAKFGQTATLTGVRLYNSDGSPYTGQWTLVSQNGIDYPEMAPVPEPSSLALAAAGGLLAGWRTLRRRRAAC